MMQRNALLMKVLTGVFVCGGVFISTHAFGADDEKAPAAKEAWKPEDFIRAKPPGSSAFRRTPHTGRDIRRILRTR